MPKPRLAIIASRFPWPLDKGDKLRLYHQIKSLSTEFEIYLFALNDEKVEANEQKNVGKYCKLIFTYNFSNIKRIFHLASRIFSKKPWQVSWFYSKEIHDEIKKQCKNLKIDLLYCQLSRTAPYKDGLEVPSIVDYQDAFSLNYSRTAEKSMGLRKWFYQSESKRMKKYELKMLSQFDKSIIISKHDASHISSDIEVITNGVNLDHYALKQADKNFDLLFTGNLDYLPNKKAIEFIIHELIPILVIKFPEIKILIAGRDKTDKWTNKNLKNLTFHTNVHDMRTEYEQSKIFIAPMFTGAGLQNKILEAMSMSLPVVSTSEANQSLKANEDKEICIARDAQSMTEHIERLLLNEEERNLLSLHARKFVERNYSWEQANQKLIGLFKKLIT